MLLVESISKIKKGGELLSKAIENRIDTIFIHVSDLERSIQWYSNLLGIEVMKTNHTGPIYTFNMGRTDPG